jgi:aliphatic nitrilase
MGVTIRHHALESGCFVINATAWLHDAQVQAVTPDAGLQQALRGGCHTAIVSPEGKYLAEPLTEGEGMVVADLDLALVTKRKRMMDSVGHYARPELLSLAINDRPAQTIFPMPASIDPTPWSSNHEHERIAEQPPVDDRAAVLRPAAA